MNEHGGDSVVGHDLLVVAERLRTALADSLGKLRVSDALALAGFDRPSFGRSQIVGRAMRELGWSRGRYRFDGVVKYAYARGTPLERETVLEVDRGADGQLVVRRREP
jgi:hypothetical protein